MDSSLTCSACVFCRQGKRRGDYNRKTGTRADVEATLCTLYPPTANLGRPVTEPGLLCVFFTDANGNQPLRHLAGKEVA